MDIRHYRSWMYNRLLPDRKGYTDEFLIGLEWFIHFACQQPIFLSEKKIRCPCFKCKNTKYLTVEEVKVHLYKKGFKPDYWYWTEHGEIEPIVNYGVNQMQFAGSSTAQFSASSCGQLNNNEPTDRYEAMIFDAAGPNFGDVYNSNVDAFQNRDAPNYVEEPPNREAEKFYEMLHAAQRPLWSGCTNHSELSVAVRMMSIKSDNNISQHCFNQFAGLMKEICPSGNLIPPDFYKTKSLVSKLGLSANKIDCCSNGCMLYYKDDESLTDCKFCGHPRYKPGRMGSGNHSQVSYKRMHYLPLIPRLKRLYASNRSAGHMRWHYENRREQDVLCHPSDGEAWKHFDRTYPEFALEPRNVRLGLCADGFTPYSLSATAYSCWPVIVTPYNLPPDMCMTTPYMFLTLLIPGPHNPKIMIDVYLQPLIDELKVMWNEGVVTYDISRKQNFLLRAALMWTINDFPAYGMLSGWSTAGKLACPYCMERTKAFRLEHGGKNTWFDCHRQFLPFDHVFRRNKNAFRKNKIDRSEPPLRLTGDQVWKKVRGYPKITETGPCKYSGYGESHNWTKHSIFWELPYWKTNLIRHNLDVMHIEKNVFDNIFNTVMDVKNKTKDNVKSRMDLKEYCRRRDLELYELPNGKVVKPKANFSFTLDQKRVVCEWIRGLKMPDGYASNLGRCVDMNEGKLCGMKSHDCHVFMERLLPIAFIALPEPIWKPLTELSIFFRDLCSTVLRVKDLVQMEHNIPIILCKLERIFPPSFFDSMEHLPIHLPYEARVGGPIQYRWMYPFERFLNKLKKMVKNKARVEGSICEAYLAQETSYFCSYYFEPHIHAMGIGANRNDGREEYEIRRQPTLSIFSQFGHPSGQCRTRYLTDAELTVATLHILLNCDEVKPYLE